MFSCNSLKEEVTARSPSGVFSTTLAICISIFVLVGPGCSSKRKPSEFEIKKAEKEETLRRQEEERVRQERELRDLQRQKFWNEQLKRYE